MEWRWNCVSRATATMAAQLELRKSPRVWCWTESTRRLRILVTPTAVPVNCWMMDRSDARRREIQSHNAALDPWFTLPNPVYLLFPLLWYANLLQ